MKKKDRSNYPLKPILVDAKTAHREGIVKYRADGQVTLCHQGLVDLTGAKKLTIKSSQQFPAIRATFDDLNKALSNLATSPSIAGTTLRLMFEREFSLYKELATLAYRENRFEPDYGTYVYDHFEGKLYLVAPKFWHRLSLITSTGNLLQDAKSKLSWQDRVKLLERKVVGVAGASVGGNILEAWLKEGRPKDVKIADLDYVELTNLNRGERMSLRYLVKSRKLRNDQKNPYEVARVNKAEYLAHEMHLVDPYLKIYVYQEGLTGQNIDQFLKGDNRSEPPIDVLVEEMDDIEIKVASRQKARKFKKPVLMMSDFGHQIQGQFQDFCKKQNLQLGYKISDKKLQDSLDKAKLGGKKERFAFVNYLCGPGFEIEEFGKWVRGEGEQPTASLPQSGATAMGSGALGAKILTLYFLGFKIPQRFIFDLKRLKVKLT